MKRIKSIDIFRGLAIVCMFLYHIQIWWITENDLIIIHALYSTYAVLGTTGFLFLSGVSTIISHRKRLQRINEEYTMKVLRREYFLRAFFILIVALLYNLFIALTFGEISDIWKWFILLTIAFSLFMVWPLLRTSKALRIIIAIIFFIFDKFLVNFLSYFQGQSNFFGIMFYLFYNTLDQDPVVSYFCFFLIGTIIGDLIFETYQIRDDSSRRKFLKKQILIPCLITSVIMIIMSFLIPISDTLRVEKAGFKTTLDYPIFLSRGTSSWMIFAMGIEIGLIALLFTIEELDIIKVKKSYKSLFYFSYYSFTVYLTHNLLFFVFHEVLNIYSIFFITVITVILFGILLKVIYKKLGPIASIKANIGRISAYLSKR